MIIPEMERPLPTFDQWLSTHGDGSRGDGFEALRDLVGRTLEQKEVPGMTRLEAVMLRMWQGFAVATVEICNIEHARGTTPAEIITVMPRALAASAFYATASVLKNEAPWRIIAKLLTEEFRYAAKVAADQMTTKIERETAAK